MKSGDSKCMSPGDLWTLFWIVAALIVIGGASLVAVLALIAKGFCSEAWNAASYALWRRDPDPAP